MTIFLLSLLLLAPAQRPGYFGLTLTLHSDATSQWMYVHEVNPAGPAARAGLAANDVITAIDGKPVGSSEEVVRVVSSKDPGSKVRLTVFRGGKELNLTANLGDRPSDIGAARKGGDSDGGEKPEDQNETALGITVEEVTPQVIQELGAARDTTGVVVTHVSRVSEAWEKGLNSGDIITEVNRVPVTSLTDYRREVKKLKPGALVILYVTNPPSRTGGDPISRYLTLRVQKED